MLERDGADIVAITKEDGTVIHAAAVQILNERGEYSATLGCLPPWIRPMMKHIDPWFARGLASVNNLTGIARTRVNARLAEGAGDRKDILSHLQNGKDATGNPMGVPELTAEGESTGSVDSSGAVMLTCSCRCSPYSAHRRVRHHLQLVVVC